MRIIEAAGWYLPESVGGTELYVQSLSSRLRCAGHDVVIAAPEIGGTSPRSYTHNRLAVYRYPAAPANGRAEARGATAVAGAARFHEWLAEQRPDVVHFHTFVPGMGLPEVKAARRTGARVVVTTHAASLGFTCERGTMLRFGRELCDGITRVTTCAACALQHRQVPELVASVAAKLPVGVARQLLRIPGAAGTALGFPALIAARQAQQTELLEHADAFVVLSNWARHVVIANGAAAEKVIVNRLGVETQRGAFAKQGPGERPTPTPVTIGFVGRAERIKGIDVLLDAMQRVSARAALRLRVIAIARGHEEQMSLERCRQAAARDPRISVEPPVAPDAVNALLRELDLIVCPSLAVEGGPTIALEAHQAGTPVIGSNLPALNEIVQPSVNGALIAPGDAAALARLLEAVAADPGATIDRWRRQLPPSRTFDDIAREYLELFGRGRVAG